MKTNVGVFFGGRSTEHEISVISASQATSAINKDKYDVTPIYISKQGKWYTGEALLDIANYKDIPSLLKKVEEVYMAPQYGDYNLYRVKKPMFGSAVLTTLDVVIPVLHGTNCEDGIFEGVLETIGIPYAGCNTLSSANGMDKITMKMILQACDIPVVDYVWFTDKQWFSQRDALIEKIESKLGQNGKNLFVNLSVRVNEDISSPVPFNLNVVMFGHFIAEKEAEQRVYIEEAIDTLYPFLRAAVSSFTANCNIPPYVLPIIGSSVLQESPAKADKEKENIN